MKKYLFSLMTLLLAFVGVARADELTVHDGTTTNGNVPVYGFYADAYLKSEMVYPAYELEDMMPSSISGMTFYTSQSSVSLTSNFQVYLKEVEFTTISAFDGVEDASLVYEGTINIIDGQLSLEFAEPYEYGGGNLFVAFYSTTTGNYSSTSWYGETVSGASVQGYSYSGLGSISPTQRNFLPKTTFTYESVNLCGAPENFRVAEIDAHEALLNWTGGSGTFNVEYKKTYDSEWTRKYTHIGWNCIIDSLDANTMYDVRVQAYCPETGKTSAWRYVTFLTRVACAAPDYIYAYDIEAHQAFIEWGGGSGDFTCDYKKVEDTLWINYGTNIGWNCLLIGLDANSYYEFRVRSNCDVDVSDYVYAYFTTLASCPAPYNLTVTEVTATTATLTWTPGGDETEWKLVRTSDGAYVPNITSTSYTLQGLTTGEIYSYAVVAVCGTDDESDWSNVVTVETTDKLVIGSGGLTNSYIPTYTYYNYSLTQQIYTAEEINSQGLINSIDFYCTDRRARSLDIYMVNTDKEYFNDSYDWIPVTAADLVYSGQVIFGGGVWTTIELTRSFVYDGTSNLAIIVDDNTGSWLSAPGFSAFEAYSQAIRIYSDDINYNPYAPSSYAGTILGMKNQIRLDITPGTYTFYAVSVSANPEEGGTVYGGGSYLEGNTCTISAMPGYMYNFMGWTDTNGNVITDLTYSFSVTGNASYVAHFEAEETDLVVYPEIDLGPRPLGAWMRPATFTLTNEGYPTTILGLESDNEFFVLDESSYVTPFTLDAYETIDLVVAAGTATAPGEVNGNLTVTYTLSTGEEDTADFDMTAMVYTPVQGDVWENPIVVNSFPYTNVVNAVNAPYYDNYVMPYPNIPDGNDVVYKLTFDQDTYLNASVLPSDTMANNGKVALYPEGFMGLGGPDMNNYYNGPVMAIDEWLYYDNGEFVTGIGAGGSEFWWGIKLDVSDYSGANLTKVSVYDYDYMDGEIQIYQTNNTPAGDPMLSQGISLNGTGEFVEFDLDTPYTLDPSQALWIVVHYLSGAYYPAAASSNTGDPNGRWVSLDGSSWGDLTNYGLSYTWMLRGYVTTSMGRNVVLGDRSETEPVEVTIGDGTGTTGYFPFYTLYNYSIAESLFLASELEEAGMSAGEISSLSWYATNSTGYEQQGLSIWMANVADNELTTTSHVVTDMTLVYTGAMTPEIGWNAFQFNEGTFSWDGSSNVLIFCQRNNGNWNSTVNWQATTGLSFNAMAYRYQDSGAYDVTAPNTMYTTATRPNTCFTYTPGGGASVEIVDMTVVPGTYYLVASSTAEQFEVSINTSSVPCPEPATLVAPDDMTVMWDYVSSVQLKWDLGERATEYSLRFGTDPANLATVVDWTRDLAEKYTLEDLNYHTTYYWQVCERNSGCTAGVEGPVWRFTTTITPPMNLYSVTGDEIMEGDALQLAWEAPLETREALDHYEVYMNGTFLANTNETTFTIDTLTYNGDYRWFEVLALYNLGDELGSYGAFSNEVDIYVMTETDVEGHVYEQDGETGIAEASVTVYGYDDFGFYHEYYFTTDEDGSFNGNMALGYYYAYANADGYQEAWFDGEYYVRLEGNEPETLDIVMTEVYAPVMDVEAEYYPDPTAYDGEMVKVTWDDEGWHTYCEYDYWHSWRTNSGSTNWAYHYPTDVLADFVGTTLSRVSLYSDDGYTGGNYTCNIYSGGDVPQEGELISTLTVDVPQNRNKWVNFNLTEPVAITGEDELWVVWTANTSLGGYPASACYGYSENGSWVNFGGIENGWTWYQMDEDTWMMRQYFSDETGRGVYHYANNNGKPGLSVEKAPARLEAKVVGNGSFVCPNPKPVPMRQPDRSLQYYRVYRTDYYNYDELNELNAVLVADSVTTKTLIDETFGDLEMGTYKYGVSCVYEGNRESPITWMKPRISTPARDSRMKLHRDATDLVINESFENGFPEGWNIIDADYDGRYWKLASQLMGTGYYPHTGEDMMSSESYNLTSGALYPDNYLVTSYVPLGGKFSFWVSAQDAQYGAEHFGVAVSTYSNYYYWDFNTLQEWTLDGRGQGATNVVTRSDGRSAGTWYQYTVDLSDYFGQWGYIAIRHFGCTDQFYLNVDDITYGDVPQYLQTDHESTITWSNPVDRDMYLYDDVDITVTLNSGDSPEGVYVAFEQSGEQYQLNPLNGTLSFYMDETGFHAWDVFRKGFYNVYIWMDGYYYVYEGVEITEETHLVYELEEIQESVSDLYVSRTGWAMWEGLGNDGPELTNNHYGADLFEDFEDGYPEGWTTIDADGDGYDWVLLSNSFGVYHYEGVSLEGLGHNGSEELMCSGSYSNATGMAINPDNYLVTPQVTLGGTFSFWACAQDLYYAADHFGVAVSTGSNDNPEDFVMLKEWTMTAKGQGAKTEATRSGNRGQGSWYLFTVDLSAYAGQTGYIALRHFDCYDQFILNVDDIELRSGNTTRHFEEIQLTMTDMDGDTLFVGNTENNYMQLPTEALEEGQVYKVSVAHAYSSGMSQEATCRWIYQSCENFEGAIDLTGISSDEGVALSWTYPEVDNDSTAPTRKGNGNRDAWDLMMTFNAAEGGHYGVAYDGDNFYTSNWGYSSAAYNFYKYDLQGNVLEGFNVPGCGTLRGMTYDGQYFYGVANSSTIYCVDLANHTLISTFDSEYGAMRGITYDPQRNGFWVIGNWSGNLTLIDRNGAVQFVGPEPMSVSDLAYYMDENGVEHVFCFNNGTNEVEDYNITTNTFDGAVFNFSSTPGYDNGSSGGCTVGEYDGMMVFIGDIQQSPNLIGVYELGIAGEPVPGPVDEPFAAAIFRDGEWIGYTVDPIFNDPDGTVDNVYEVRIVYGGTKQCPYNNAYFTMSCPQVVEIAPDEITQTTDFVTGWTWWSTYIDVADADVLGQLKEGLGNDGQIIKSQTAATTHLPTGAWVGSLTLNNELGYMVKALNDVTVDITGSGVTPEDHEITLNPGWTWIGYPSTEAMPVADALVNLTPQTGDVIKGQSVSAMYMAGAWRGALVLTPGMGLMYKSGNSQSVTLTYATPSRMTEVEANITEAHWNANYNAYPTNMTVLAVVELNGEELSSANYELAAFANGECRGSVQMMYVEPLDRYMALLTIAGEEAAELHFGLYDAETGEEYLNADEVLGFEADAIVGNVDAPFVIRFRGTTGVDELSKSLQVYPNPVEANSVFSVGSLTDVDGEVRVEIVNALGAKVSEQTSVRMPASIKAPAAAGVYMLKITVDGKETCCRKLVVR